MSTNYYGTRIPKYKDKEKMIALIWDDKWSELHKLIPKEIHIGKSSGGWKFCFDHNNWEYFDKTQESIMEFIHHCEIRDEYGRIVSEKDFWDMVKLKENDKRDTQYRETHDGLDFSTSTGFF